MADTNLRVLCTKDTLSLLPMPHTPEISLLSLQTVVTATIQPLNMVHTSLWIHPMAVAPPLHLNPIMVHTSLWIHPMAVVPPLLLKPSMAETSHHHTAAMTRLLLKTSTVDSSLWLHHMAAVHPLHLKLIMAGISPGLHHMAVLTPLLLITSTVDTSPRPHHMAAVHPLLPMPNTKGITLRVAAKTPPLMTSIVGAQVHNKDTILLLHNNNNNKTGTLGPIASQTIDRRGINAITASTVSIRMHGTRGICFIMQISFTSINVLSVWFRAPWKITFIYVRP